MSRKLTVLLAMAVLVGAMSLKSAVTNHSNGTVLQACGGAPVPLPPKESPRGKVGGAPVPLPPSTVAE